MLHKTSLHGFTPHLLPKSPSKGAGFTLVELLIVIGLLAILATTAVVIINPVQLLAQARDAKRTSNIDTLDKLITVYDSQGGSFTNAAANTVYLSLPDDGIDGADANAIPNDCDEFTLPALPSPWEYRCVTATTLRLTNGTGWIPLDFSTTPGLSVSALPVDPVNSDINQLYYTFIKGSWNLTARLESDKAMKNIASKDKGVDPTRFESGSDKQLWTTASGLVGYWPLDEGTGTSAADLSGNNNTGTLINNPTWITGGQVGGAVSTDGITQYITMPSSSSLNNNSVTISMWFTLTSNLDCDGAGNWRSLIKKSPASSGTTTGWDVVLEQSNLLTWDLGLGGAPSRSFTAASVVLNTPVFLTFTYNAATGDQNSYVNGVLKTTRTNTPTNISSNANSLDMSHGVSAVSCPNSDGYVPGKYDDVRVYSRALTASEISAMYNATK